MRPPHGADRLVRLACLAAAALLAGPAGVAAPAERPPDILLIVADDQTWRDLGCYGNPDVRTPNLDRLAAEGMRFTGAFTATAMCTPARHQLYTGLFPVRSGGYANHSRVTAGIRSLVHLLRDRGYRVGLAGKVHVGPPDSFPFEMVRDVPQFIGRDPTQPYCLVVASKHPHMPWSDPPRGYDPALIAVPPGLVDNAETRLALARYYTDVTKLDAEVGELLGQLESVGRPANTLVLFTSEHGASFPFGKWTCYEMGLRTALLVRWPGRVAPAAVTPALVQTVDVLPTLIEAAGGRGPAELDGRSFLPLLRGEAVAHRDRTFGVHTNAGIVAGRPYPIRSIRTPTHRYVLNLMPEAEFTNALTRMSRDGVWNSWVRDAARDLAVAARVERYRRRPAEELYDLIADPDELENLAGDRRQRPLMDALRGELEAWMRQQGDQGVATELAVRASRRGDAATADAAAAP